MKYKIVADVPDAFTFILDRELLAKNCDVELRFFYEFGDDRFCSTVSFSRVVAYRFVNEGHLSNFVPEAWGNVIEDVESEWIASMRDPVMWIFEKHHYLIYLQDVGLYEFVAEGFSVGEEHAVPKE